MEIRRSVYSVTVISKSIFKVMKLFSILAACVLSQEDGSKCKETALNMACVTECNIEWGACQARGLHFFLNFEVEKMVNAQSYSKLYKKL